MSSVESGSTKVLQAFIAGANAQYRAAGLSEYQMRVRTDGSVETPDAPRAGSAPRAGATTAAMAQASDGAAATPSGAAPALAKVESPSADAVALSWGAVPGAVRYGVYQDGQLIGTVPGTSFTASIAADASSTLQIDAELEGGRRSPRTEVVRVARSGSGAVEATVAAAST